MYYTKIQSTQMVSFCIITCLRLLIWDLRLRLLWERTENQSYKLEILQRWIPTLCKKVISRHLEWFGSCIDLCFNLRVRIVNDGQKHVLQIGRRRNILELIFTLFTCVQWHSKFWIYFLNCRHTSHK